MIYPIDPLAEFVTKTQALLGAELEERKPWNRTASADAIRHFALGTSDANPLWIDAQYANDTPHGRVLAPPLFLASVRYPVLHGAATSLALESWISDVRFTYSRPIGAGDELVGRSRLLTASALAGQEQRIELRTQTTYHEASQEQVAEAEVTLVRMLRSDNELRVNRECQRYTAEEMRSITELMRQESIRGNRPFEVHELQVGSPLPAIVRGPLSVSDMVSWNAGVGPATAGGAIGMRALVSAAVQPLSHPLTGAPISPSHQHEDPLLSIGRGMSLPFDNGIMRLAWMMPLVTNWIGDAGTIATVHARILRPNLYGDVTWYSGHIAASEESTTDFCLEIEVRGVNQLGERTVEATIEVRIPQEAVARRADDIILEPHRRSIASPELCSVGSGEPSLFEKLEEHAQERPDAIALADEAQQLTYRQLLQRVTAAGSQIAVAGRLPAEELRVAILLPRSAEAVVAQLAVVCAGGAYVPVDLDSPQDFLRAGLLAAGVNHVLVSSGERHSIPEGPWTELTLSAAPDTVELSQLDTVDENRLALVMFTSGSSSGPRGVEISRRSLWRYLAALTEAFGPAGEPQVFGHTASLAFSASTRQCYLPLWLGQTLHVASSNIRRDPLRVLRWLRQINATNWDTTPSVMSAALRAIEQLPADKVPDLSALRRIMLTGELLEWKLTNGWKQRFGDQHQIFNLYSQTETAGTVAVFRVPAAPQNDQGALPIGNSIPGVSLDIVDEQLTSQNAGVAGQLRVTSRQLSRGYAGAASDDPRFSNYDESGTPTSYLTGDMAVAESDGTIKIVGRADRRVKIRGFRINLEDVERALRLHPHVADAAVTVDSTRLHASLVAAYATRADAQVAPRDLRAFLKRTLPDYMLPAHLLPVAAIPKTPSGKTAYHELSALLQTKQNFSSGELRPEHQQMAEIWRQLLEIPAVAADDDFFTIGGDSLLATSLAIQIERELGIEVAPESIYRASRLDEFVELVGAQRELPELLPLKDADGTAIFCLPGRRGGSLYLRQVIPHLPADVAVYGVQPTQEELHDADTRSFDEIAQRLSDIIAQQRNHHAVCLLGYSFAGYFAFDVACKLMERGIAVDRLMLLDTSGPNVRRERNSVWQQLRKFAAIAARPTSAASSDYLSRKAERISTSIRKRLRMAGPDRLSASQVRARKLFTRAIERHQFKIFPGKIDLIQCTRGRLLALEPPANGWLPWTAGGVDIHPVAATHATLLRPPHVTAVADVISKLTTQKQELRAAA